MEMKFPKLEKLGYRGLDPEKNYLCVEGNANW
jgi:hypothetical protein